MEISFEDTNWVHDHLRGAPPARFLPPDQFASLAESIKVINMPAGHTVIRQGQPGETCYLIRSGSVGVWAETASEPVKLAVLKKGDFFGEVSILTGESRNATVITEEQVELFAIPARDLLKMVRLNFEISENLAKSVSRRGGGAGPGVESTSLSFLQALSKRLKALLK